ncbi:hypothetical protein K438DRAFT_1861536 [Mycena galopus ATCC 62051]|nr:hypothetical protein K438DRAFT_1861536 [Mycena galopus ATCC 62051]
MYNGNGKRQATNWNWTPRARAADRKNRLSKRRQRRRNTNISRRPEARWITITRRHFARGLGHDSDSQRDRRSDGPARGQSGSSRPDPDPARHHEKRSATPGRTYDRPRAHPPPSP